MPELVLPYTDDQQARYASAVQRLNGLANPPTADELLEPLRAFMSDFVRQSEVTRGDVPARNWGFWTPLDETPEQATARFEKACDDAIEARLDAFAQEKGYRNSDRLRGYATSTNALWKAQADFFQERWDRTWESALDLRNAVMAGKEPMPAGVADVVARMPVLEWPIEAGAA